MAPVRPARALFHDLLFNMDGTINNSTPAVIKHYQIHFKPDKANWEYVKSLEAALPAKYGSDAQEIPGAKTRLNQDETQSAFVTSGTTGLVTGWLKVLGLPEPKHMVVAEDVKQGKPD
ncbi:hypothetical protein ACJ73_05860 [Blastomyces percursus]|uniref:Uncharacterized protein n=1 Tax=Blastomyces percursus TaxID=1658174 RepID=A0A1J9Q2E0_9EURO|nr:hypothetical protein ACJ73_05860 [Blastomyces percursus]